MPFASGLDASPFHENVPLRPRWLRQELLVMGFAAEALERLAPGPVMAIQQACGWARDWVQRTQVKRLPAALDALATLYHVALLLRGWRFRMRDAGPVEDTDGLRLQADRLQSLVGELLPGQRLLLPSLTASEPRASALLLWEIGLLDESRFGLRLFSGGSEPNWTAAPIDDHVLLGTAGTSLFEALICWDEIERRDAALALTPIALPIQNQLAPVGVDAARRVLGCYVLGQLKAAEARSWSDLLKLHHVSC